MKSVPVKGESMKGEAALGNELADVLDVLAFAFREDLVTEYEVRRDGELPYALGRYLHYIDLFGAEGAFMVGEKARVCLTDSSRLVTQLIAEGMVRKEEFVAAASKTGAGAVGVTGAKPRRKRGQPKAKLVLTEEGRKELLAVRRAWRAVGARIAKMLSGELPSERQAFARVAASLGKRLGGKG